MRMFRFIFVGHRSVQRGGEFFRNVTPAGCVAGVGLCDRVGVNTFREHYCVACDCRPDNFRRHIFWRCLHPHVWVLAPFISLFHPEYFAADRGLIARAACARTLRELNEEIRDYADDSRNHGWWRGRAQVRLSTHRLRALARVHLPTMAHGASRSELEA